MMFTKQRDRRIYPRQSTVVVRLVSKECFEYFIKLDEKLSHKSTAMYFAGDLRSRFNDFDFPFWRL